MAQVHEVNIQDSTQEEKIADLFCIEVEDLESIGYEIDGEYSNDGMLYGYFVTVGQNATPEELEKLEITEEMKSVDPWFFDDYDKNEDDWFLSEGESLGEDLESIPVLFKESSKEFDQTANVILELLKLPVSVELEFNHHVMLHMHAVSSFEHFLYKSMVYLIMNNEEHLKRFFKTDIELKEQTIKISEVLSENKDFKKNAIERLKDLTFHNLQHIAPTYKNVLLFEFSNEEKNWLSKAVKKRHDCAHRAGHDKEGKKVDLSKENITDLINKLKGLVNRIDEQMEFGELL